MTTHSATVARRVGPGVRLGSNHGDGGEHRGDHQEEGDGRLLELREERVALALEEIQALRLHRKSDRDGSDQLEQRQRAEAESGGREEAAQRVEGLGGRGDRGRRLLPSLVITPFWHHGFVDPLSPPEFAQMVRRLNQAASAAGMQAPSFVSPPRHPRRPRTIRWLQSDRAMVAVRRGNRAADAVVSDMIDGVVAANRLSGSEAERRGP